MFPKNFNKKIKENKKISVEKILQLIGDQSFFYLLFLVTFITSIPSPSWGLGTSTVPGGLIVIFLSIQIILGFKQIYLPNFLKKTKVPTKPLQFIYKYTKKLQYFDKKNVSFFKHTILKRISGLLIFCCGILMSMPIILTNWAPSFTTSLISIAHILKSKNLLIILYILTVVMILMYIYFFSFIISFVKKYVKKYKENKKFSF